MPGQKLQQFARCAQAMRISSVVPASAPVHCAIYHQVGDCIMPREGVFCKVIEGGSIAPGDTIEIAQ